MRGISVVVPLYNEEESVGHLYAELAGVLASTGQSYEIVFVDDGSRDATVLRLADAAAGDNGVKIVQFRRNYGQTAAMAAGLANTTYDTVVTMDGDLQNDPTAIPAMIKELSRGFDLVAGWRKDRKDALVSRKIPSRIANWLISKITGVKLHDYGCTLKVIRGDIARELRLYGEMHRFIPALAHDLGAKITEMPVNHRARQFGRSKYGISRTIRVLLDLLTVKFLLSYSKRPIHFFGVVGALSAGLGGFVMAILIWQRYMHFVPMGNRPLLSISVLLVIVGLQFLSFGLLAEIQARTYHESQSKPVYSIKRIITVGEHPTAKLAAGE